MKAFINSLRGLKDMDLFVTKSWTLLNPFSAIALRVYISRIHLLFWVTILPKYLYFSICYNTSLLTLMFAITFVPEVFKFRPFSPVDCTKV